MSQSWQGWLFIVEPVGTGTQAVSQYPAAACLISDMSGSAFRMQTGWSLDVSRHPAATGLVLELAGSPFHMRTGRSPAVSRYSAATCLVPEFAGSEAHRCTISVWPCTGAPSDSGDYWYILRHQPRSRIRPTRQAKIHLSFRSSVVNRAIFSFHHTIFPVGLFSTHLPTSGLQTFWSNPTTFISSPTAYPGKKILGHGHQIVVVTGAR